MASVLFDRDRELDILSEALASARAGDGTVALISGEAGIGKTTLLTAFLERLDPTVHVFRGACEDLSVAEPMGPLRDIIREAGPAVSHDPGDGGSLHEVQNRKT